jgi:predicted metal-dependent hydrolase
MRAQNGNKMGISQPQQQPRHHTLLKYPPNHIIEYIVYHEITHSIERKHNEKFWNLIAKKFRDYQNKEKTYRILVRDTKENSQSM